jgi:hypothetical protein
VTTALKPASRAAVARLWPRPDEHPVMNQVAIEKLLLCPAGSETCRTKAPPLSNLKIELATASD